MATALSPLLTRLTEERATGVLIREHGALYLTDGRVVHAESPAAPGLEALLAARGAAEAGAPAGPAPGPPHTGRVMSAGGGRLEILRLTALFDAAYFALAPADGPTRFRSGAAHWRVPVRPVEPRAVEREALRRGRLLQALWPHPAVDTAPVRCRPRPEGRAVTARRRSLLALADGVRTPAAIAHALGRPGFHTLIEVRRLAAEGFIDTPASARVAPVPLPAFPPEGAEGPGSPAVPGPAEGPERRNGGGRARPWGAFTAPDTALLRRIRDALEGPG
ncbi:transcriptional regulator [Streptomyces sp. CAU 1734]|uniref:transcriptional regulator n=1 Tax=Streptomyces sp. CAU 1734 TaxID=3140360 RepID=UPI0032600893